MGPMVGIGLVSYSWHFWHWPLISFTRTLNFGEPSFIEEVSVGFVSFILAVLTYRYIELQKGIQIAILVGVDRFC